MSPCLRSLILLVSWAQLSQCNEQVLHHTEVSKLTRSEGDAALEEYSPQIYKQYTSLVSHLHTILYFEFGEMIDLQFVVCRHMISTSLPF